MQVKAPTGLKCPMEGNYRKYINDAPAGVTVADTTYYRRLVAQGSLLTIQPAVAAEAATQAPKVAATVKAEIRRPQELNQANEAAESSALEAQK